MATLAQKRYALQAANEVLNDLGVDQEMQVDVFDIVDQLGLFLVFNDLDNLLGAVVPKGTGGIMITSRRGPAIQRYTAAHEIGHWILDFNEPAFDAEDDIFFPDADRERLAQLFAGQLLMPPPLVFATCAEHGISRSSDVSGPALYLVARDMGASYEAAARQLASLDIIEPATRDHLLSLSPAQVKTELCRGHRPRGTVNVWPVSWSPELHAVNVTSGDEVVLLLPENKSTGQRWLSPDDLEARSLRRPSPPPESFADAAATPISLPGGTTAPTVDTRRSVREVRTALDRLPGNDNARRTLGGTDRVDRAASLHSRFGLAELQEVHVAAVDALNPPRAAARMIDDRFANGWAEVRPSEARSVRQAIAGRGDLVLPDAVHPYLNDQASDRRGSIDTDALPIAATGERIIALGTVGEGELELELVYSSAFDPEAPNAAAFGLTVTLSATPELLRRRQLIDREPRRSRTRNEDTEES